jgi:glycosyltransferase involved in cell wall biosynthesis
VRFVILNQFYPPDLAPTGRYAHDLARELAARGHHALAICSRRGYSGGGEYAACETLDGVEIRRVGAAGFGRLNLVGKLLDYASFFALAMTELSRTPADAVISLTTPPWIGLAARLAARRGAARIVWVMDLYPDAMSALGGKLARAAPLLTGLTRRELGGAELVIALGETMAQRIRARYVDDPLRVVAAPLWAPPDEEPGAEAVAALRAERGWNDGRLTLMYSGNFGLGHRFDEFLATADLLGEAGPRWVFCGAGKRTAGVEAFKRARPSLPIELMRQVPTSLLPAHLRAADAHLVSLEDSWQGIMVPSKIQAAFVVGRPVIFVGGAANEAASWVRESGGGWTVGRGDVDALRAAVREASDPAERARRGEAARSFARRNFDAPAGRAALAKLVEAYARADRGSASDGGRT